MSRLFNDSLNMTKRYSTIAGLNIQPHQVTLALLTKLPGKAGTARIAGVVQQPLATGVIAQGIWRDTGAIRSAIGRCRELLGRPNCRVVMCLADDAVVTARVPRPELSFDHQQQAALEAMVAQISPWSPEQSVMGWVSCTDGLISLAVCQAQGIQDAQRCLVRLNMRLLGVEPESQSLLRLLHRLVPRLGSRPGIFVIAESARISVSLFVGDGLIGSHNLVSSAGSPAYTQQTVLEEVTTALQQLPLSQPTKPALLLVGGLVDPALCQALGHQLDCEVTDLDAALDLEGLVYESASPGFAIESDGAVALGNALWRFDG